MHIIIDLFLYYNVLFNPLLYKNQPHNIERNLLKYITYKLILKFTILYFISFTFQISVLYSQHKEL